VTGMEPLLDVRELSVRFLTQQGPLTAVDRIRFGIQPRETLALVGESGCGKSVTALAIMQLLPKDLSRFEGSAVFNGKDILKLAEPALRALRGREISMIFQEPMTSLNPVFTIAEQIDETLYAHTALNSRERGDRCLELLESVRIADAPEVLREYPHRLSGGMRQRAMIAMAVACNPRLLIADEPTTALDVTIQAQVLRVMSDLKDSLGMSILLITHDLGVVAEHADRVCVMYAGSLVEIAPVRSLFAEALHPYTQGLMKASPRVGSRENFRNSRLAEIPGNVPSLHQLPPGCAFAPRCRLCMPLCRERRPLLVDVGQGRSVACFAVASIAAGVPGAQP
jgi:peptide/nickel transport system ATP-binding protein